MLSFDYGWVEIEDVVEEGATVIFFFDEFYYILVSYYFGTEITDNVDVKPKFTDAWLYVSPDFSPKHYDVILIFIVESFTGHF